MTPGGSRWLQTAQMAPDGSTQHQMAPDPSRWHSRWVRMTIPTIISDAMALTTGITNERHRFWNFSGTSINVIWLRPEDNLWKQSWNDDWISDALVLARWHMNENHRICNLNGKINECHLASTGGQLMKIIMTWRFHLLCYGVLARWQISAKPIL